MGIIDYYRICLRYKWLIIVFFIVFVSTIGIYIDLLEPVYEAECKLLLLNNTEKNSLSNFTVDDIMMQTIGKTDEPILTKIEMLKTRPIMEETIKRCSIQTKDKTLINHDELLKRFKFENVKMTNIIQIIYRDNDRNDAARIANMLAIIFIEENQRINKEKIKNTKDFIEMQLVLQKRRIEEAELAVMKSKAKSRTISIDKRTSVQVNTIAELEAERIRLEAEVSGFKAQESEIEDRLNQNGSQTAFYYSSLIGTKEQGSIALTNLVARIQAINNELEKQYRSLKNLPALEIELARLTRDDKIMNEIYTNLLSKYEECKIREAAQVSNIKIIEPAIAANDPVFPKKIKSISLAGLAGLLMGIGLSFLIEFMRGRPQSIEEIQKILRINSLGSIPTLKNNPLPIINYKTSLLLSDAIATINTNLRFKEIMHKEHIALMVTSAQSKEGKTTLTANLAIQFSNSGRRTAIVNLDLRHQSFNKLFGCEFNKGLTDFLTGEISLEQIEYKSDFSRFTIIPSGQVPSNPTELIFNHKMTELINQIRSSFDVVLFDTAPITMFADPIEIARYVDGIILVVNIASTPRKALIEMNSMLDGKNLPIMGLVINKDNKLRHYYNKTTNCYQENVQSSTGTSLQKVYVSAN